MLLYLIYAVTVCVLHILLMVTWHGLQTVVVFSYDHTHLLIDIVSKNSK